MAGAGKSRGGDGTGSSGAGLKIHHLRPAPGARTERTRVGRGGASKGKTAGRGTKGTGARGSVAPGFEGGQLQLAQRIPKLKGFHNPFRVSYAAVNLDTLDAFVGDEATPETLSAAGRVRKGALVKVLGRGELHRAVRVRAHAVSVSARTAIEAVGGSVEILPPPFGHGRPPARGNALTNR
jgi:large subunit ribosomal protein L15